ncbi:30S ribosome-binding factor RbfA [Roseibacillus ishigakijimensis]|uniref:Ribosome-binding factor A n=1 Tax=Roseibacillus ishigakijimensis TaxID=454146 RepID=A0A934VHF1_9BACT|nr:30S ribosome-binding factor RbfA [Roseibacillus ishigakijimensis]MBK1833883.1 30S ribosome-binding factor RbfA [Roseibacillus ishigakijimensis]
MSQRLQRVDELLKREISAVVQKDFEWKGQLVSINAVEVTKDLREAKVWVGILGGDPEPVLEKLARKHGLIQSKVMKRVKLRNTPVLSFRHDASAERGVDIVNLLEEVDRLPTAGESPEQK